MKYNHCLNKKFCIEVPALPAGEAKVDVTFEIDRDGLLTVTAVQPITKKQVQVNILRKDAHITEKDAQMLIERARKYQAQDDEELKVIIKSLKEMGLK